MLFQLPNVLVELIKFLETFSSTQHNIKIEKSVKSKTTTEERCH